MNLRNFVCSIDQGSHLVFCDTLPEVQSDPTSTLLSMLKKFNGTRHHVTGPEGKQEARDYITKMFKQYGLHVWTEQTKIGNVSTWPLHDYCN